MADRVTTVRCSGDMDRLKGFKNLADFISHVQSQTDLEVTLVVAAEGVRVWQQGSQWMSFEYPFEAQDIVDWTYHWENDNSIRYEIHDDLATILDIPIHKHEAVAPDLVEDLRQERTERVLGFVHELLWGDRWINLAGIDLLIMDPAGGPLELTAAFEWVTPTIGRIMRPYRPPIQQTVARLYCDGLLALAWPSDGDDLTGEVGVTQPLRDLIVVDLAHALNPLELYDAAYESFRTDDGQPS